MESVSNTLSILLLYFLWKIDSIYDKYFGKEERAPKPFMPTITAKNESKEAKSDVNSNPSKSVHSLTNPESIMTPAEEEMLKFSCAKGYSEGCPFSEKLRDYKDQVQIPRSTFTAMWIDSCVK